MVTDAGTVAAPGFEEVSVKTTLDGADTESVSEMVFGPAPLIMVSVVGKKAAAPPTCTVVFAEAKPGADAVTVALPKSTPATCGATAGAVCPWAMKVLPEASETLAELLLASAIVRPPTGAGELRVIDSGIC